MAATHEPAEGPHLLVVIDHLEAKIYKTEVHGAVPQRIVPHDPHGHGRHLHGHDTTDGKRHPESKAYYEAIAKTLHGADQILVFGSGKGASSAMHQLLADLKHFHPDIARHVVGEVRVDNNHSTDDELLAKAREFYDEYNQK